jgi:hypothetical protein
MIDAEHDAVGRPYGLGSEGFELAEHDRPEQIVDQKPVDADIDDFSRRDIAFARSPAMSFSVRV